MRPVFNTHRQPSLPPEQQLRIVDLDESYIHHHYRRHNDSLFDPNDADFRQPRTQKKGKRLCFVAAIRKSNPFIRQAPTGAASVDNKACLVPNSVWKSSGDYHQNFNGTNFVHWFKTQLLPNLSQPSLIRLDNAKYHRTKPATTPSGYRLKKAELQQVLTASGIPFAAKDTSATLRKCRYSGARGRSTRKAAGSQGVVYTTISLRLATNRNGLVTSQG